MSKPKSEEEQQKSFRDDLQREEEEKNISLFNLEFARLAARQLKDEGNTLYFLDMPNDADEKYIQALDACPIRFKEDRAILFSNRAAVAFKTDDKESTILYCTKALDLNPNYLKAIIRRAQAYEDIEKLQEALKDFEHALSVDPTSKEANAALERLPIKICEKDKRIKAEKLDKLRELSDQVLRPFGLSSDNFVVKQDSGSGGYSIQLV